MVARVGGAFSCERGTPVTPVHVCLADGKAPPRGPSSRHTEALSVIRGCRQEVEIESIWEILEVAADTGRSK